MKLKICLIGEGAVGKTSLVRRFVLDEFDDRYLQTIGTKVSKKEVTIALPQNGHRMHVDMTVWDIMGQKGFRDLLKESYFYGAQGVLAVSDLTRPATLAELGGWIEGVYSVTGKIPIQILANKLDLVEDAASRQSELEEVAKNYNSPLHLTSAKTGVNVNEAFHRLAEEVAARHVAA
jgi:small GTP-binding protein